VSTVGRLLRHPITLIKRVPSGVDDAWGQPVLDEERLDTVCHYQQRITGDLDKNTDDTVFEDVMIFLPGGTQLGPYDAVELQMGERTETMEVIGQPSPVNNARLDAVNHVKLTARRAGA